METGLSGCRIQLEEEGVVLVEAETTSRCVGDALEYASYFISVLGRVLLCRFAWTRHVRESSLGVGREDE